MHLAEAGTNPLFVVSEVMDSAYAYHLKQQNKQKMVLGDPKGRDTRVENKGLGHCFAIHDTTIYIVIANWRNKVDLYKSSNDFTALEQSHNSLSVKIEQRHINTGRCFPLLVYTGLVSTEPVMYLYNLLPVFPSGTSISNIFILCCLLID